MALLLMALDAMPTHGLQIVMALILMALDAMLTHSLRTSHDFNSYGLDAYGRECHTYSCIVSKVGIGVWREPQPLVVKVVGLKQMGLNHRSLEEVQGTGSASAFSRWPELLKGRTYSRVITISTQRKYR